jgi:protein TonB
MNQKDPKPSQSPPAETLEDSVYRASLSEGNKALKGSNPLVTIPTTIVMYVALSYGVFYITTKTEVGKKVLRETMGIDLTDEPDKIVDDEAPPPPPPPPAPVAVQLREEIKDAPPPPPITDQEVIPDEAPRELPTKDYSTAFGSTQADAGSGSGIGTIGGVGPSTAVGPVGGTGGASATTVHDFAYNPPAITHQPPKPTYPPLAKAARIKGRVVVEVTIGTNGAPTAAHAVSGPQQLRQASVDHAMKFRWEPARMEGQAVQARFFINIDWTM